MFQAGGCGNISTREQARYALEQVGKRYQRLLGQEIRAQVGADVDVEAELQKLVGGGGSGW